jgi:hypothetical protein
LVTAIRCIRESGISLDYIETNAAWITDDDKRNREILIKIAKAGGDCVMVSADPFHIAYVPFWKNRKLLALLRETGISYFIWQERYWATLSKLDEKRTSSGPELNKVVGYDIIGQCAREYGMGFNGRALNLHRGMPGVKRGGAGTFVSEKPCGELSGTGHFHADYLNRYIAPGCTGMGILTDDLEKQWDKENYPVMARLLENGTAELLTYTRSKGYEENPEGYVSKCDVCFQIRKFLITSEPGAYPDLSPPAYYRQDY